MLVNPQDRDIAVSILGKAQKEKIAWRLLVTIASVAPASVIRAFKMMLASDVALRENLEVSWKHEIEG